MLWLLHVLAVLLVLLGTLCSCSAISVSGGITIHPNIRVVDLSAAALSARQRKLFCHTSVPPEYTGKVQQTQYYWYFRSVRSSPLSQSQSLTVVPKSVNDTGKYICSVTYILQTGINSANQVTHNINIDLIVVNNSSEFNCAIMPFFTQPGVGAQSCTNMISTSVVYAEVGQDVLFDCNAISNYEVISYFIITNTGSQLRATTLEIKSVTKSDRGNYTCLASNWRAFNNHTFTLIVTEPPTNSTRLLSTTTQPTTRPARTSPQPGLEDTVEGVSPTVGGQRETLNGSLRIDYVFVIVAGCIFLLSAMACAVAIVRRRAHKPVESGSTSSQHMCTVWIPGAGKTGQTGPKNTAPPSEGTLQGIGAGSVDGKQPPTSPRAVTSV